MRNFIQSMVMYALRNIKFLDMVNRLFAKIDEGHIANVDFSNKGMSIVQYTDDMAFAIMMAALPPDYFDDKPILKRLLERCYNEKELITQNDMTLAGLTINEIEIVDHIVNCRVAAIEAAIEEQLAIHANGSVCLHHPV